MTRARRGRRHVVTGKSKDGVLGEARGSHSFQHLPGLAIMQVHYRNQGQASFDVSGWRSGAHELEDAAGRWSFSGATHEDRRDWVQPLKADFEQRNSLSMAASDYGGGIRWQPLAPRRGPRRRPRRTHPSPARSAGPQDAPGRQPRRRTRREGTQASSPARHFPLTAHSWSRTPATTSRPAHPVPQVPGRRRHRWERRRPNPPSRRCGVPGATNANSPSSRSWTRCPRVRSLRLRVGGAR